MLASRSCTRRTRLCGFLFTALTTSLLCAPEQALGAAPGATAPRASTDVVGSRTEDGDADGDVDGLTMGLGGLHLEDGVEDGSEFRAGADGSGNRMVARNHPQFTELERRVGIVNSGHGDAKGIEKPKPRRTSFLALLPDGVSDCVAAFTGVDVQVGAGPGQTARVGDGRRLVDRLDVLGLLSTSTRTSAAWENVRTLDDNWMTVRRTADLDAACRGRSMKSIHAPLVNLEFMPPYVRRSCIEKHNMLRDPFQRLCDATSRLLSGETTGYGRGGSQMQVRRQHGATVTTISPALRANPVQLRPGAQVRVKPWGSFGNMSQKQMEDFLFSSDADPQLLEDRFVRGASTFVRWLAYLEQYANAEQTGEVVQFVPGAGAGRPPRSYVVRFLLPALPWSEMSALHWGMSPFWDRPRWDAFGEVETHGRPRRRGAEQVPPGGWRLTRQGAERLPAGQNELLLEVPYNMLYVDVAAQNGQNPFQPGVVEALRYE